MKDDSGSHAVFTEQASSASQMTAAKVIAKLLVQDKQSAYTQKMEDDPKFLKIPKSECPDFWIRLPRHNDRNHGQNIEDPVVSLERNLYGHTCWPLVGRTVRRSSTGT